MENEQEAKQDVTQVSSPEQVVEQQLETPVTPEPQGDVDERGVSWRNVAMEKERKLNELVDKLPTLIEEMRNANQNPKQQREYTIAELEQYAIDNPSYRPWVEEQKAEINRKVITSEIDNRLQSERKKANDTVLRNESFNYVKANYPEAFDRTHPMFQEMNVLMSDTRFQNDPMGLRIAAEAAYGRVSRNSKQAQQLKQEVKSLQKKTFVEGGGKQNISVAPVHKQALDRVKQTGSIRDAAEALKALYVRGSEGE